MKIVEIDRYDDFLNIKDEWSNFLERCDHTVFSTWEWLSTWWKHFGNNRRLVLLLAKEGDDILGTAPLMYSVHSMFGLRRGKIEFIGTPDSDYNDFIIAAGKEVQCIDLFIDYLNSFSENWDCIDLTDIPENSGSLSYLKRISQNFKPVHKCPYLLLPKSYDLFLKDLSRKTRSHLRKDLRRAEKNFKVEFADYSVVQSLVDGMKIFFELHQERWESKGFSGVFADQKICSFNLEIAKSFSQRGWLGLFLLFFSGNPVAALYGFKYRSKFYYYLPGFDPRYSRYGVGNLIVSHVIAKCIQEKLVEFDFLRGAENYKSRWNTKERWNRQSVLIREGLIANIENWLYDEYWSRGNRLKDLLKMSYSTVLS